MLESFHGYANKPTWLVMAWLTDDEPTYNYWAGLAEELDRNQLATSIKEYVEAGDPVSELVGLYRDLMDFTLAWVNWHEVADYFLED